MLLQEMEGSRACPVRGSLLHVTVQPYRAYITSIIVCLGVKHHEPETALLYGISDAAGA